MTLGSLIREQRKLKGMTQKELADQLEISHPYMSKIENDRERPISFVLKEIASALDLDYYELSLAAGMIPHEVIEAMQAQPKRAIAMWRKLEQK